MSNRYNILSAACCMLCSSIAFAGACDITVTGNDAMQFAPKTISVPSSCKQFTINFSHIGKQPKKTMGHNWVLVETKNINAVAMAALKSGAQNDYLPKDNPQILAQSKLIGSGEKTVITIATDKLSPAKQYSYICTFPGHSSVMQGQLTVK